MNFAGETLRSLAVVAACLAMVSTNSVSKCHAVPPTQDVVFAKTDAGELKLNLFLPADVQNPPLVVFIHGGGWRNNSYKTCHTKWLTEYGFAVASIGYRLTDQAKYPSQVYDCKAAVRWLRAHADEYGYNADKVAVAGTSAGGYLALMLGVTGGEEKLEGDVGGNHDQSSRVQAVVDYYGPSDFVLRSENQPAKTEPEDSPVHGLLGVAASKNQDLARDASPAFHVTADDAPLLIVHGDKDSTVKMDQSERMVKEYSQAGLEVKLQVVKGGGHGGTIHFTPEYQKPVVEFLKKHLQTTQD